MRRLNVHKAQIEQCITNSIFALSNRPTKTVLQKGELLLLQLTKKDALLEDKLHSRIDFAIVFDRLEQDQDGSISRAKWPTEKRVWKWIVYGSSTIPTIPFSLEDLQLSSSYDGQDNARYIDPTDEDIINPLVQWSLGNEPNTGFQMMDPELISQDFGRERLLSSIKNYDQIGFLNPPKRKLVTSEQCERSSWLSDSLKLYYDYRCQICEFDSRNEHGYPTVETHHILYGNYIQSYPSKPSFTALWNSVIVQTAISAPFG